MTNERTTRPGLRGLNSIQKRVRRLLVVEWQGNQSAMAKAIKHSRTGVAKVVNGQRMPGRELLTAIVTHSRVSPKWLMDGTGEMYAASAPDVVTSLQVPPVARQLLPGTPQDHPKLLTGEPSKLGACCSATAYSIQLRPSDPLLGPLGAGPGNEIIIETDKTRWFSNLNVLDGQICVIHVGISPDNLRLVKIVCKGGRKSKSPQLHAEPLVENDHEIVRSVRNLIWVQPFPESDTDSNRTARTGAGSEGRSTKMKKSKLRPPASSDLTGESLVPSKIAGIVIGVFRALSPSTLVHFKSL